MTTLPRIHGALIGFAVTMDPARSKTFYVDQLGFTLVEDSLFSLVLDANGSMIRLQKVQEFTPQHHTILGWSVADIKQTVAALAERGVVLERIEGVPQDEIGVWSAPNGDQIGWIKDPEGQILSLSEFR